MITIVDTIGQTPLVRLQRLTDSGEAIVALKCERTNPGGSIRDRPARFIVETAEQHGWLVRVEPSFVRGKKRQEVWRIRAGS